MLSRALKGSVDSAFVLRLIIVLQTQSHIRCVEHYQAFAAALPHHASVLGHLSATQTQVIEARTALQEAKDALGTKRSDLVQLSSRGQIIDEMMLLLDEM